MLYPVLPFLSLPGSLHAHVQPRPGPFCSRELTRDGKGLSKLMAPAMASISVLPAMESILEMPAMVSISVAPATASILVVPAMASILVAPAMESILVVPAMESNLVAPAMASTSFASPVGWPPSSLPGRPSAVLGLVRRGGERAAALVVGDRRGPACVCTARGACVRGA